MTGDPYPPRPRSLHVFTIYLVLAHQRILRNRRADRSSPTLHLIVCCLCAFVVTVSTLKFAYDRNLDVS